MYLYYNSVCLFCVNISNTLHQYHTLQHPTATQHAFPTAYKSPTPFAASRACKNPHSHLRLHNDQYTSTHPPDSQPTTPTTNPFPAPTHNPKRSQHRLSTVPVVVRRRRTSGAGSACVRKEARHSDRQRELATRTRTATRVAVGRWHHGGLLGPGWPLGGCHNAID